MSSGFIVTFQSPFVTIGALLDAFILSSCGAAPDGSQLADHSTDALIMTHVSFFDLT